jgi:hypothetical protein
VTGPVCWCGKPAAERHHLTGRLGSEDSPYLDPDLWAWACWDDHALASDDQLRMAHQEADLTRAAATRLDKVTARLRRVAAFFGRLAECLGSPVLVAILATFASHAERWADELGMIITILDAHSPGWRTLPGMNG